jgi:hypothetical protein
MSKMTADLPLWLVGVLLAVSIVIDGFGIRFSVRLGPGRSVAVCGVVSEFREVEVGVTSWWVV